MEIVIPELWKRNKSKIGEGKGKAPNKTMEIHRSKCCGSHSSVNEEGYQEIAQMRLSWPKQAAKNIAQNHIMAWDGRPPETPYSNSKSTTTFTLDFPT